MEPDTECLPLLTIISGMAPVILGALIAFATTWWFARKAERDRRLGLGYSLFLRASDAMNSILEIRRVLTLNLRDFASQPAGTYKWQLVQIATGFDWQEKVAFQPDELTILALAKRHDLINDLSEMARLHNILHNVMADYGKRREQLSRELLAISEDASVLGTTVSSVIPVAAARKLQPDIMLVEDLLEQILEKVESGSVFSKELMKNLGPAIRASLKDKRFRMTMHFEGEAPDQKPDRFPQSVWRSIKSALERRAKPALEASGGGR